MLCRVIRKCQSSTIICRRPDIWHDCFLLSIQLLTFLPEVLGCFFIIRPRVVVLHVHNPVVPVGFRWCFACISNACPVFNANKPVWVVHHWCTMNAQEPTMSLMRSTSGPRNTKAQRLLLCVHVIALRYQVPVHPNTQSMHSIHTTSVCIKAWTWAFLLHVGFRRVLSWVRMCRDSLHVSLLMLHKKCECFHSVFTLISCICNQPSSHHEDKVHHCGYQGSYCRDQCQVRDMFVRL